MNSVGGGGRNKTIWQQISSSKLGKALSKLNPNNKTDKTVNKFSKQVTVPNPESSRRLSKGQAKREVPANNPTKKISFVAIKKILTKLIGSLIGVKKENVDINKVFEKLTINFEKFPKDDTSQKKLESFTGLFVVDPSKAKEYLNNPEFKIKEAFIGLAKTDPKAYADRMSKIIKSNPEEGHKLLWDTKGGIDKNHNETVANQLTKKLSSKELAELVKFTNNKQIDVEKRKSGVKLLRGNDLDAKLITAFANKYIKPLVRETVLSIIKNTPEQDKENIEVFCKKVFSEVEKFSESKSEEMKMFKEIQEEVKRGVEDATGDGKQAKSISDNLMFLRVVNPILSHPEFGQNKLVKQASIVSQRITNGQVASTGDSMKFNALILEMNPQIARDLISKQTEWGAKAVCNNPQLFAVINVFAEKNFQGENTHFLKDVFDLDRSIKNNPNFLLQNFNTELKNIQNKYLKKPDSSVNSNPEEEPINISNEARNKFSEDLKFLEGLKTDSEKMNKGLELLENLANELCSQGALWTGMVNGFKEAYK